MSEADNAGTVDSKLDVAVKPNWGLDSVKWSLIARMPSVRLSPHCYQPYVIQNEDSTGRDGT